MIPQIPHPLPPPHRKAFTLIELMVVVAIIAILIGILLPSLSQVRTRAREVACATLLRGWGQSFHTYATEFNGFLPNSGDRTRNPMAYRGKYFPLFPEHESSYLYVLPPRMGRPSWLDFPNGKKPTGDIWQCPLAEVKADVEYGYQASIWGYHSFAMNAYLDANHLALPPGVSPYPPFLTLSRAVSPASTILMYETTLDPAQGYGQAPPGSIICMAGLYPNDGPSNFGDRHPHARGKLGGNIVFLDGHLEWHNHLWEPSLENPTIPAAGDRLWYPY